MNNLKPYWFQLNARWDFVSILWYGKCRARKNFTSFGIYSFKIMGGFLGGDIGGGGGGAFFFLVAVRVWSVESTDVSSKDSDFDFGGTGGGSMCPPFEHSADWVESRLLVDDGEREWFGVIVCRYCPLVGRLFVLLPIDTNRWKRKS